MEYFCHICKEWLSVDFCKSHFEGAHASNNMTLENLQKRMTVMGGLQTRDEEEAVATSEERPFVTNNFRHYL